MQDQSVFDAGVTINVVDRAQWDSFWRMIEEMNLSKDRGYYERCFERQDSKELLVVAAQLGGRYVGYAVLNWQPKYAYFKKCGLPEIQDLNVLRDVRRKGIGAKIIGFCEGLARDNGYEEIGIGVGLDGSFGAAQRLYVRLGYIPDGAGVTYDRKQVAAGEFRPVDENLSLMMSKKLF